MLMELIVIALAFEMGGDEHRMLHAGLHRMLDLRGDAVGIAKHDLIVEKQMNLDVMHLTRISMAQGVKSQAVLFGLTA